MVRSMWSSFRAGSACVHCLSMMHAYVKTTVMKLSQTILGKRIKKFSSPVLIFSLHWFGTWATGKQSTLIHETWPRLLGHQFYHLNSRKKTFYLMINDLLYLLIDHTLWCRHETQDCQVCAVIIVIISALITLVLLPGWLERLATILFISKGNKHVSSQYRYWCIKSNTDISILRMWHIMSYMEYTIDGFY